MLRILTELGLLEEAGHRGKRVEWFTPCHQGGTANPKSMSPQVQGRAYLSESDVTPCDSTNVQNLLSIPIGDVT